MGFLVLWLVMTGADSGATDASVAVDLRQCIEMALNRHTDASLAAADLASARAEKTGTRAAYLPRVTIDAGLGYTRLSSPIAIDEGDSTAAQAAGFPSHYFGLSVYQTLFDGGRSWNGATRATREVERKRVQRTAIREAIALRVIGAYFNVLTEAKKVEVLEKALTLSRDQLRLAEARFGIGTGTQVDVALAKVSEGQDRVALERQQQRLRATKVRLNLALGRSPEATIAIRPPRVAPIVPEKPHTEVPSHHAELQAASAAQAVAEVEVRLARGGHWPTLRGVAYYQRQGTEVGQVYARLDEHHDFGASLQLSLPIFEGWATSAKVQAAQTEVQRQKLRRREVEQELNAQLVRATDTLKTLAAIGAIETASITAAEESLVLAQERYALGMGTALELRDAQLSATRARLAAVETRFNLHIALAAYHYAVGNLLATYLPVTKRSR